MAMPKLQKSGAHRRKGLQHKQIFVKLSPRSQSSGDRKNSNISEQKTTLHGKSGENRSSAMKSEILKYWNRVPGIWSYCSLILL